uniref:NADH dehydrogenase subunit 3 n=1 Tax=Illeis bistigmosa TaxID=2840401 RepID=UPI001FB034EE|nr:NADH dehydrogenase subunit 3 [Illeis bistigmosa]UJP68263.1 NADH dehydrogenase subunit 3 [Illeis bistigmosa]
MMMVMIMAMILMILIILMSISLIISKKTFKDREKSSPFECGFDPKNSARLPFSIHFFLIALIFLIFDVEITLILPFIYSMKISSIMNISLNVFLFIMILLLGLYHEWKQGALNWSF